MIVELGGLLLVLMRAEAYSEELWIGCSLENLLVAQQAICQCVIRYAGNVTKKSLWRAAIESST
jgi:hypothetical protein